MKQHRIKAALTAFMMIGAVTAAYGENFITTAKSTTDLAGVYVIRNVNSGLYLGVDGTNVEQLESDYGYDNIVWRFIATSGSNYRLVNLDSGASLIEESSGNVAVSTNDYSICTLSATDDGNFNILVGSVAVEVINAYTYTGANVQTWDVNGASCQDWELVPLNYVDNDSLTETTCTISGDLTYIPGDLNDDGVVNVYDLQIAKSVLLSNTAKSTLISYAMDVNADGACNVTDVIAITKYLLTGENDFALLDTSWTRTYYGIDGEYTYGVEEDKNSGYTGTAYLNLDNAEDITSVYNVYVPVDGVYALTIRYANGGSSARTMSLLVNNELSYWTITGDTTGAWTEWVEETIYIPLQAGVNQLTLTSETSDGAPNIDYLQIAPTSEGESDSNPLEAIVGENETEGRQMENLNRGVVAANTGSGMLISWRSLATDDEDTNFKVYRNGVLIAEISSDEATCYVDSSGSATDTYTVDTYVGSTMTEYANEATVFGTANSGQSGAYMDIALNVPEDQTMPDGTTCSYSPNDCSVADVDGDGEYEIIVKWDPDNSKDNSKTGYTGTVFLDCYKLDGTQLWRIDLGVNIRAGAHYTQFLVYDFDGDGYAELMCKTADGTVDGLGNVIGSATADYRSSSGLVLEGPEYLTLFDALTGAALDTIDYVPDRDGASTAWGDAYGNRCERYLAAVAYLNGETPSALFCRGYYTRTAVVAYDIVDKKIVQRWIYDTGYDTSDPAYGQGNHSVCVMDVDSDGKDELIYGSCCFDDDGTLLYSTGLGHGDCLNAGDLIPEREGLEVFQVHEEAACAEIHDAATGEIIWMLEADDDVGRGIAINFMSSTAGTEFASSADGMIYAYNTETGQVESTGTYWNDVIKWNMNSMVWWDGDLERDALDRTMVESPTYGRLFTGDGVTYNNGTKANSCLTCDLFGDWREELIFPLSDGTGLRIFTTTYDTDIKLFTLMQDSQYRTCVANQNVGYNQAPTTSFFLGTGYDLPETPLIYVAIAK